MTARLRTFEEIFQTTRAKSEELALQVAQIEGVILQELSSTNRNGSQDLPTQSERQTQVNHIKIHLNLRFLWRLWFFNLCSYHVKNNKKSNKHQKNYEFFFN